MGHKGSWMSMGLIYIQSFHEEMVVYPNYSFEVIVELPRYIYIHGPELSEDNLSNGP